RRLSQLEHDLRLYARLHRASQALQTLITVGVTEGVVIHIRPDRRADMLPFTVTRPHTAIGKTDLATYRRFALGDAHIDYAFGNVVAICKRQGYFFAQAEDLLRTRSGSQQVGHVAVGLSGHQHG